MKTPHFHWKLIAAMVLLLALVLPAQAARFKRYSNYRLATFQLSGATQIVADSNQTASLLDLRRGERVSVLYDQALVAHRITAAVTHNPKPLTGSSQSTTRHHSTGSPANYWSVRGVVQSVNPQAGTLTIVYKAF